MTPFDRILKTMLRPWLVVCLLSFFTLSFFYFDKPIAWFFHGQNLTTKLPFLYWLTKLGLGEFHGLLLALLFLFFRYVRPNKTWETRCLFLWLCLMVPYAICLVFKIALGRARPELLFDHQLYGFYGLHFKALYWSFPSGHTTTIISLTCGLIILFPRYMYGFLSLGLMVALTRILLTNHYLSDVMTTSYLTILEVGLLVFILRRKAWLTSVCQPLTNLPT